MRAGKAYISSLGTTGLLVASSLLLLVVVGALVAFDRWPSQAAAQPPETIALSGDDGGPGAEAGRVGAGVVRSLSGPDLRGAGAVAALPRVGRAAAAAGGENRVAGGSSAMTPVHDPVVSGLPAPDTAPGGSGSAAGPGTGVTPAPRAPAPAAPSLPLPDTGAVTGLIPGGAPVAGDGTPVSGAIGTVGDAVTAVSPTLGTTVSGAGKTFDSPVSGTVDSVSGS